VFGPEAAPSPAVSREAVTAFYVGVSAMQTTLAPDNQGIQRLPAIAESQRGNLAEATRGAIAALSVA